MKARSPVDTKPVCTVCPPLPTLRSRLAEGSLPLLLRNGPLAWILTGRLNAGFPLTWTSASSLRSALSIEFLKALSSSAWASLSFPPPPQPEAATRAKRSRTAGASRRNGVRTPRRVVEPPRGQRNSQPMPTLHSRMPIAPRASLAVAAMLAALACAAGPAAAGELIQVKGHTAQRVDDPFTPPASELEPVRGARPLALLASVRGRRAVGRVLRRARRKHKISASRYRSYVRTYRKARSVRRRLHGARGRQLGYVIASLERIALRGRLIPSRMPSWFAQVQRNTRYWPRKPFPAPGDFVSFGRSEVPYRYFPGRGLQYHPLGTFKRANLLYGACKGAVEEPCSRTRLKRLLDEMARFAVRRSRRWIAWEYIFDFGGGSPPWISGMADATGIQALGRAAVLLGNPRYPRIATKALGQFGSSAPLGVKTRGFRGGVAYLQYSFAPRTYVFNAFTQTLIGLHDFAHDAHSARAMRFYDRAEPELERQIPFSDLGDWSLYSYRGEVSDQNYHELLREVMHDACIRHLGDIFCTYAKKYRGYQVDPPEIEITGPATTTVGQSTRIRFTQSKPSAVELRISREGRVGFDKIASFHRGSGSFSWRPDSSGTYSIHLGAKEQRTGKGLKGHDDATIEVN